MADEPFKATDKDWRQIENRADIPQGDLSRAICELRDRVAALEAERVAPVQVPPTTVIALDMVDSLGRSFNLLPETLNTLCQTRAND